MKPQTMEELQSRITAWVNETDINWTIEEARYIRNTRKQLVFFLRYGSRLSLADAYYAFEQVKSDYFAPFGS